MKHEYRVISKREGLPLKYKLYQSERAAKNRVILLSGTIEEKAAILYPNKAMDRMACCDGHECGCFGNTVKDALENYESVLPPIESVVLQQREVADWI